MMRSEYAKDKQKTFVEFTFEYTHGENKGVYVVKRTTNFRKSGVTSDVVLTLPDGEVFNGKNKETDEKIQSLSWKIQRTEKRYLKVFFLWIYMRRLRE